jgi:hypothetical protein
MLLRDLHLYEIDALYRFSRSTSLEFFLKFSKNPEQAHDMNDAFSKIKKEAKRMLPASGISIVFDKDFPDGNFGLDVRLTTDESVALAVFTRKIDLDYLIIHLDDKKFAKHTMHSLWAIRDALHWEGTNLG